MPHYDAVILGTGHNALVAQAYFARSGLRTLALDRASERGESLHRVLFRRIIGADRSPRPTDGDRPPLPL